MGADVERQQQQFQMCRGAILRSRGDAGDGGQHFFRYHGDDVPDIAACFRRKQRGKAPVFQIAAEQGADPGAGDAEGMAGRTVIRQHEDIAEQFAHRSGLDLAAVRRTRGAALLVPIREELAA